MNREFIKNQINDCLENVGLDRVEYDGDLIGELQDSLVFVSFIIELEETFGIEFDERIFDPENFKTINRLIPVIEDSIAEAMNNNHVE